MNGGDPLPDSVPDISVDDFDPDDVASTVVQSHQNEIMAAVESAVWHTLIDGAGCEAFPSNFRLRHMRDVIHKLEADGFGRDDDTAFYAGSQAFDEIWEFGDEVDRSNGSVQFDGFDVFEVKSAPEGVVLLVDPTALYRVPPEVISRQIGLDTAATVSSPIGVRHPAGVAAVNIDVSD